MSQLERIADTSPRSMKYVAAKQKKTYSADDEIHRMFSRTHITAYMDEFIFQVVSAHRIVRAEKL